MRHEELLSGWRALLPFSARAAGDARRKLAAVALVMLLTLPPLGSPAAAEAQTVSFVARRDFAAGSGPSSVALGDFNGGGKLDLAVANENSSNVSVLINNTPSQSPAALSPRHP